MIQADKPTGILEYKSITAEVKDVDLKSRTVTGLWSNFTKVDHDRDWITKGAYAKTIAERGPLGTNEIFFLNQHNWAQPLDKPKVLEEQNEGLYFESGIVNTSYGNDAIILYDAGLVAQHSVGFVTMKSIQRDGYREITEIKLYEGSCVTLGANDATPFTGFKRKSLTEVNDTIAKMVKLLKNGNLTDDGFLRLEFALKQLQLEAYELGKNSVEVIEPGNGSTQQDDNPNDQNNLLKSLVHVLENKN